MKVGKEIILFFVEVWECWMKIVNKKGQKNHSKLRKKIIQQMDEFACSIIQDMGHYLMMNHEIKIGESIINAWIDWIDASNRDRPKMEKVCSQEKNLLFFDTIHRQSDATWDMVVDFVSVEWCIDDWIQWFRIIISSFQCSKILIHFSTKIK